MNVLNSSAINSHRIIISHHPSLLLSFPLFFSFCSSLFLSLCSSTFISYSITLTHSYFLFISLCPSTSLFLIWSAIYFSFSFKSPWYLYLPIIPSHLKSHDFNLTNHTSETNDTSMYNSTFSTYKNANFSQNIISSTKQLYQLNTQ